MKLRPRRLEAEKAEVIHGPKIKENDQANGRLMLADISHTHTVQFENLNLADTASVRCRVASGSTNAVIEFRDGSPQGDLLVAIEVKPTGGWDKWVELSAPLKAPNHRTSVCLVFTSPSTKRLMNLDWVEFGPR